MATQKHIRRIVETWANFLAQGDDGQTAILTDQDNEHVWRRNSQFFFPAVSKDWNTGSGSFTFHDSQFKDLTVEQLLVSNDVEFLSNSATRIRFATDTMTFTVDGLDFLTLTEGATDTAEFGAGVETTFNADVYFDMGSQSYRWTDRSASLVLQSRTAATANIFEMYTNDGDGTDSCEMRLFGVGTPADISAGEYIAMRYQETGTIFEITTQESGGTVQALRLFAEGNTNQLYLSELCTAIGVGVVPEDWDSTYDVIRVGAGGFWASDDSSTPAVENAYGVNAYYDDTDNRWERINSDYPMRVVQSSTDNFVFQGAAVGSADSAITWLDAFGIHGNWATGAVRFNASGIDYNVEFYDNAGTPAIYFYGDAGNRRIGIGHNSPDRSLHVREEDTSNTTINYLSRLTHELEVGTDCGAGLGVGTEHELDLYGLEVAGRYQTVYTGGINGAEYCQFNIEVLQDGTLTEVASFGDKFRTTPEGGLAIKLTNNSGGTLGAGRLVEADTTDDDSFKTYVADDPDPIGVTYESSDDGDEAWVVISGIADVAMGDNEAATRGYWVRGHQTENGYCENAAAPSGGTFPAIESHFVEVGHLIESVSAGGGGTHILARCVLHFN